jgi:hypothetical protein
VRRKKLKIGDRVLALEGSHANKRGKITGIRHMTVGGTVTMDDFLVKFDEYSKQAWVPRRDCVADRIVPRVRAVARRKRGES